MITVGQALARATARLHRSPSARVDAEALLRHVSGLDRASIIAKSEDELPPDIAQRFEALVARRVEGEPVAYLTGRREFWSLALAVTPDVLIPRSETELLVERALARIPLDSDHRVADLGTGSGAVALAIAIERPRARVVATEASAAALALARANAARLGTANVEFRRGDWLAALATERLDMIVSNPPYVATGDPHLRQGDPRFEPRLALEAGADGLAALRRIVRDARGYLAPGGWLLLEHGYDQKAAVGALLAAEGYADVNDYPDYTGHDRVAEARA